MSLSTHVLDAMSGRPAAGVVVLPAGASGTEDASTTIKTERLATSVSVLGCR